MRSGEPGRAARALPSRSRVEPTMKRLTLPVTSVACVVLMSQLTAIADARDVEPVDVDEGFIARVLAHTNRSDVSLRATRALRAGTASGKHQGWMEIETVASPSGGFRWSVLDEGGSERTRERVFRQLLQAEALAWRAGTHGATALTRDNYTFTPTSRTRDGRIVIRLQPKRRDARLVDGTLTVRHDGSPVLLEGYLAKSPSFWVKRVHVVKRFARIGGLSVPTSVESVADVKLVGQATFSMQYRYQEIDGRPVNAVARMALPE